MLSFGTGEATFTGIKSPGRFFPVNIRRGDFSGGVVMMQDHATPASTKKYAQLGNFCFRALVQK